MHTQSQPTKGLLNTIEKVGNKLPDPTTLFFLGTLLILFLSHIAATQEWTVREKLPERTDTAEIIWQETGKEYRASSLLARDGFFWFISHLVDNFINFPPLGVVLVGMLGIGVAERTGLIAALIKGFTTLIPGRLLTPSMLFIGIMSSMTLDAGYVVLPPLAAALYKSVGRSPLAGLAAVFAGVSAGFNANLFITSLEPLLSEYTSKGAQIIDPSYQVNPACNWWFMIASTFLLTLTGWGVTSFFVEKRLSKRSPEEGGPAPATEEELKTQKLTSAEKNALRKGIIAFLLTLGFFLSLIFWKDGALYGKGEHFNRWVESIVPMLFFCFIIPGIVFGISLKTIRSDKEVAKLLIDSIRSMAPIIVLAFFAAQFIECFNHSGLGKMLASWGGQTLGQMNLSVYALITAFIAMTMVFNIFIGSMSAKYALFAPIFVPMLMLVGISPELTQLAYRIGDSTTNIITPLNAYLVIILVFIQKYMPKAGIGTLISTMLPYTLVFTIVWVIFLLIWIALGAPLGPGGSLHYEIMR